MEGQIRLPLQGQQFPRDIESGSTPQAHEIMGLNEYLPRDMPSGALIEEYPRAFQTPTITTPSQQSIPSPSVLLYLLTVC